MDCVNPGEEQNERDHKLQGERTAAGDFGGRKWRHATDGGWFSWELKVLPDQPQELWVTYWGSDGGNRVFDILVDGEKIATQRLENNRPDQFYDEVYAIPAEMTKGKDRVTVRFQAQPGHRRRRVRSPRDAEGVRFGSSPSPDNLAAHTRQVVLTLAPRGPRMARSCDHPDLEGLGLLTRVAVERGENAVRSQETCYGRGESSAGCPDRLFGLAGNRASAANGR